MTDRGKVYLVGAGPGDPGLITVKGLRCLAEADEVLYDGLVNPLLLLHTSATARRTCRTCTDVGRILKQEEINEQLIAAARAGRTVVRLKGGDPFIFGRGSEEAAALREEGVDYEIVSGVTAATAASAYAGISLTHRQHASAVAFVTGHEVPGKSEQMLDYSALASFPGTLVFYMGLHRLPDITRALIGAGKAESTSAAVISRGTLPAQKVVSAPLGEIAEKVAAAELHAPSLIVIGDCVSQRDHLQWFEQRPLFGKRIGITRPAAQAAPTVEAAVELGAQPILMPTIEITPPDNWDAVDDTLARLSEFDWLVFTSANGVRFFFSRLLQQVGDVRLLGHLKLATIGLATAEALGDYHLRSDIVPAQYRAEALAEELKPHVSGKRVLWARADRGRDVLPQQLAAAGADLCETTVYCNRDVPSWPPDVTSTLQSGDIDWICLSSPSIARNVVRLLDGEATCSARIASISPVTTAAAQSAGLQVDAEATEYTWPGLLNAIVRFEAG